MSKAKPAILVMSILIVALVFVYNTASGDRNTNRTVTRTTQTNPNVSEKEPTPKTPFEITDDNSLPYTLAASVNDEEISSEEFERRLHKTIFVLEMQGVNLEADRVNSLEELRFKVINELVKEKVIMQLANTFGILATDEQVEAMLYNTKANFSEEDWQALLESRGITEENLNTYNKMKITEQNLVAWMGGISEYNSYLTNKIAESKVIINTSVVEQMLQKI